MNLIDTLFGKGPDLTVLQMCSRALAIYFIALIYVRLAGKRAFGKISTFDNIIAITLGAILTRAVVGVSPFVPVIASSLLIVLLHRLVAWVTLRSHYLGKIVKGKSEILYKNGQFNESNLRKNYISHHDLMEGVRIHLNQNKLDNVEEIYLERNGEFGVVEKKTE